MIKISSSFYFVFALITFKENAYEEPSTDNSGYSDSDDDFVPSEIEQESSEGERFSESDEETNSRFKSKKKIVLNKKPSPISFKDLELDSDDNLVPVIDDIIEKLLVTDMGTFYNSFFKDEIAFK